ncbi:unnamed protein product [Heligmosomoides polygyrus]|uniref:ATP-dependent DNA helicase n=1 Tax=Heligmosomoides polygyrus TaxID=6339 RepID=A0A3P8CDH2_HELPZ|nr:unnamed protein product [Heligmosomoides polygyrus]
MRKKCKKKNVDYKDPTKRAQACRMIMHEMEDLTGRTMKVQELSHTFKNLRDTEDIGIRNGVRQFLRILNARVRSGNGRSLDGAMRELESSDEESLEGDDGAASEGNGSENNPNFDVQESSKHQYLFKPARASEEIDVGVSMWLQPGKVHTVPIISLDLIVLPGQMVPMQIQNSVSRSIVQRAIDGRSYLGLLPIVQGELNVNRPRYGILLQVML